MRIALLTIVMLLLSATAKAEPEQTLQLSWAEWSVPKSAAAVLAMPVLQESMKRLQESPHGVLQVFYPGGDEGSLWAVELRGWLVSLGLEANRIKLISGSRFPDRLQLQVDY
jgi:hypothetical protein